MTHQTHWEWVSAPWSLDLPSFLLGVGLCGIAFLTISVLANLLSRRWAKEMYAPGEVRPGETPADEFRGLGGNE